MRIVGRLLSASLLAWCVGCQNSGSLFDLPTVQPGGAPIVEEDTNPVYLPLGESQYGQLFETLLQTLGDYGFEFAETNRYDGRIETLPRIAPGVGLFLKAGSPSVYDRFLSTLQTYRHRVSVVIMPASQSGYFVEVIVRKELEDLPRPLRSTVGAAIFRNDNNVDRQFEVIDATLFEPNWIFRGRDVAMEQELLRRIKRTL